MGLADTIPCLCSPTTTRSNDRPHLQPTWGVIHPPPQEDGAYSRREKMGGALAHSATLIVGIPLAFLLSSLLWGIAICPVISYLISRRFRRHQLPWASFQALQAAAVQLIILGLVFLTVSINPNSNWVITFATAWFLLLLYSLWGAVDTLMGYDFRYIFIGNLIEKVSHANLTRINRRNNRPENRK